MESCGNSDSCLLSTVLWAIRNPTPEILIVTQNRLSILFPLQHRVYLSLPFPSPPHNSSGTIRLWLPGIWCSGATFLQHLLIFYRSLQKTRPSHSSTCWSRASIKHAFWFPKSERERLQKRLHSQWCVSSDLFRLLLGAAHVQCRDPSAHGVSRHSQGSQGNPDAQHPAQGALTCCWGT